MLSEKENSILDEAEDAIHGQIRSIKEMEKPMPLQACDALQTAIATLDRIIRMRNQSILSQSERSEGSQSN